MRILFPSLSRATALPVRIFLTLFFLVFLGIGSFLTYFAAKSAVNAVRARSWPQNSCRILESRVVRSEEGSRDYLFQTRYVWESGGREHEGSVYRQGYTGSTQISDAETLARRFPESSTVPCFVDPRSPEKAVLAKPSLGALFVPLFPLLFVAVGLGGIFMAWRPRPAAREAERRPLSSKPVSPAKAAGCLAGFFGIFLAVGLATSLFFALPALRVLGARSWREVPCTVVSSAVRSHSGSDSTTYSVDILYEYEAGGRTRRSSRYEFLAGSSGGYEGKAAVVAENPPGRERTCFVNPENPDDAVLMRGFSKQYFVALVPLLFAAVGLGGMVFALRTRHARAAAEAGSFAASPDAAIAPGPVALKTTGPVAKVLGMVFVALFWNGIVSVFVWQMLRGWKSGGRPIGLTIFLLPFVLVGLALVVGVVYSVLAAFNPRPSLTLSAQAIPLGGEATLTWSFSGSVARLAGLKIRLEGREEARYRRGTKTYTDRETFASIPVYDSPGGVGSSGGSATVRVPRDAMHSFTAPNNRIVWTLKLSGEIPSWPDVTEEVEIDVGPAPAGGVA